MATPVYIEQAVAAALKASPEVGALADDRVYPLHLPQGATLPAIVYQRIESTPNNTLRGYGSESVTLALHSYAQAYEQAKELALAARGVMAAAPLLAMAMKEADAYDEKVELPRVSVEYLVQQSGGHDHG